MIVVIVSEDDNILDRYDDLVRYFDRDGQRITLRQWGELRLDYDYIVLRKTPTPRGEVSTVWLGIDHGYINRGDDPPEQIFETMVFGEHREADDEIQERYATEAEALAGHERIVALLSVVVPDYAPPVADSP